MEHAKLSFDAGAMLAVGHKWIWKGEANRRLDIYRPCKCGCDYRGGRLGVGYISASDHSGNGFTIWLESEEIYRRFRLALNAARCWDSADAGERASTEQVRETSRAETGRT